MKELKKIYLYKCDRCTSERKIAHLLKYLDKIILCFKCGFRMRRVVNQNND